MSEDTYRQGLEVKRRLFGAGKERPVAHGSLADELLRLSDEVVFGRVYTRPGLDLKTRSMLTVPGGSALLIDESYNANPASMRAAIVLLGQAPVGPMGRRIAVLGDMLELGPQGGELHRALADVIAEAGIDLVFCSGPLMQQLWQALPSRARGGYAETAVGLEPVVIEAIGAGDAVMVKGSLGSKMGPIVKALEKQFPKRIALERASG